MLNILSMRTRILVPAIACTLITTMLGHFVTPSLALAATTDTVVAAAAPQATVTLPDGTEFMVRTTEEISSKTATEGDALTFKVDEDVKIDNHIVIAAGTVVKGTVADVEKSGRMGKSGKLGIRMESTMTVDDQKVKLRGSKGKEGNDKTGTVIALTVLLSPLFLLKRGKNAVIKEGTKLKVYTDETIKVKTKA